MVQDTSTEEHYVVFFEDGTYCDNLPPTDIVVSYLMHLNYLLKSLGDSWYCELKLVETKLTLAHVTMNCNACSVDGRFSRLLIFVLH